LAPGGSEPAAAYFRASTIVVLPAPFSPEKNKDHM